MICRLLLRDPMRERRTDRRLTNEQVRQTGRLDARDDRDQGDEVPVLQARQQQWRARFYSLSAHHEAFEADRCIREAKDVVKRPILLCFGTPATPATWLG